MLVQQIVTNLSIFISASYTLYYFDFSIFVLHLFQGSLAWEPYHLQYTERPSDERVVTEREQAPARAGKTRFKGERTGTLEATLAGLLTRPLAERLARCETLSALTAQSEPYGFLFIHLLSKQLVIQCPVETKQATLLRASLYRVFDGNRDASTFLWPDPKF